MPLKSHACGQETPLGRVGANIFRDGKACVVGAAHLQKSMDVVKAVGRTFGWALGAVSGVLADVWITAEVSKESPMTAITSERVVLARAKKPRTVGISDGGDSGSVCCPRVHTYWRGRRQRLLRSRTNVCRRPKYVCCYLPSGIWSCRALGVLYSVISSEIISAFFE